MSSTIGISDKVNQAKEVGVALIRSPQSLAKVEREYRHGDRGKMDLRSYFLRPYHQSIIEILAQETGKGKAEVVRDLIDEWCEAQLEEARERA